MAMKRFYTLLLAAVALFGFAACSQDNDILLNEAMPTMTVYATFEDEATRMELGTNNVTPKWEAGDEIVINNTTFTAANGGRKASFTTTSETLPSGSYTAVYRGEGVTKNCIAAEQQAVAGSFPKQTPAVAAGSAIEEGMTLSFKNVAALLQFQAVEAGDYTFEAVGGELLAADFTVNGDATVTFATSGSSKVTLKGCEAGNTYMVSVAPATLSQGLKVCVGTKELKTGGVGMELERSTIYNLTGLSEGETYTNLIWGIVGGHQGWDTSRPTMLDVTNVEGLYVATNIQLGEPGFKFVKGALKDWNDKSSFFGAHAASNGKEYYDFTAEIGANWYNVYDNDLVDNGNEKYPNNIGVSDWSKRYDVYLYFAERGSDYNKLSYTIVEHGEDIVLPGNNNPGGSSDARWALIGAFNSWDINNPTYFTATEDADILVAKSVAMEAAQGFLIIQPETGFDNKVGVGSVNYVKVNHFATMGSGGSDICLETTGTYDFYFNAKTLAFYAMSEGTDYKTATEQTVNGQEPVQEEPEVTDIAIYLKPNNNWKADNARFAAYFWNNSGNVWVNMTDADNDGIYECCLPEGYELGCNIIFCRMNPATTGNNWNNKWNQTSDLKTPTDGKNLYTVKDGTWDKGGGEWSLHEATGANSVDFTMGGTDVTTRS